LDLARLKSEHYQLVSENSERTQQMKDDMANSVNYEYVKNILISYFMTNDTKVHENLLRVVFLALKFSQEE
jgi:GRIP domain